MKSTDGGITWDSTGLTFAFPQVTAVQKIVINPKNTQTVYAATSEGVAKSTNAGATWAVVNHELMAMDLVINPADTAIVYSSHGNLNSTSNPGIYYSEDAGTNWTRLGGGLPSSNFGRTALSISPTNPNTIYAGVSHDSTGALIRSNETYKKLAALAATIAVIVASLYPAPTVLLARVFFREHIPPVRALGLALAVAGIALIGLR